MSERQHTRAIVMVHSHIIDREDDGAYDLSADVISVTTSKTIKGVGSFSFVLVPRRNYLNLLFPNDVVNIYFDPGDGVRGFVRTMLGYVDRIERTESVDENGAMSTVFTVSGSDFSKAFDKTEVVFNPALAAKKEFIDERFGLSNLFGDALRSRGVMIYGTPAEVVENLLSLLMGFGTQFLLPTSYPTFDTAAARSQRIQRYKNHLPTALTTALRSAIGIDITSPAMDHEQLLDALDIINKRLKEVEESLISNDETTKYQVSQADLGLVYGNQLELQAYQTLLKESKNKSPAGLLDLLSFSFIETLCIDGFQQSNGIVQSEGPISSIVYGLCNELVNELMFDLRPVVTDSANKDGCFGTMYSTDEDDCNGVNVNGTSLFRASTAAVRYVPAVVMREYPHSVVNGIDLSQFTVAGTPVGVIEFGPIFAKEPNDPGRKILQLSKALTPEPSKSQSPDKPLKHLDVVVIRNTDVTASQLGRSDVDVVNYFEMYNADIEGTNVKWNIGDFSPLLTPASIFRHGLRKENKTTTYANYGHNIQSNDPNAANDLSLSRTNLIRWILLKDHWCQHNPEYLSGTIAMRAMPEIRVGYRLDWADRKESYYVDAVNHQWQYPGAMRTSVQVTRGQRNDPFPAYIPPVITKHAVESGFTGPLTEDESNTKNSSVANAGGGNRQADGRLGDYFYVKDTRATANAVGGKPTSDDENTMDKSPEANHGGYAEYAGLFTTRPNTPASVQLKEGTVVPNNAASAIESQTPEEDPIESKVPVP